MNTVRADVRRTDHATCPDNIKPVPLYNDIVNLLTFNWRSHYWTTMRRTL